MLDDFFGLSAHKTNLRTELLAGWTTFLTMAYILFVQPAVLSGAGLDAGAVLLATCLSSAAATLMMGLYGRYPIAQAPGMGENFFFASVVAALAAEGIENDWQTALGIVFASGILFLGLTLLGIRESIINSLSPSLRAGVAAGIGLFIAFIGLKNASLIVDGPTLVQFNTKSPLSVDIQVFCFGFLTTCALFVRRIPGAILWGILLATLLAFFHEAVHLPEEGLIGLPAIEQHAAFQMSLKELVAPRTALVCLPFVIVFLFMDLFDTTGTLVAVAEQGNMMRDGELPRARQALLSDAVGTVLGACLGTSTVTSYIESIAGVEEGGRTGLVAVTVAVLFLLALLFSPIIIAIGAYLPITASALVIVGAMMARNATNIDWSDRTESIPAFLILLGIPLTFSIADGLALGFIAYPLLKLFSGKWREATWLSYLLAAVLILYFIYVRPVEG